MGRETGAILSIRFQQITIRKIVLEFVISSALLIKRARFMSYLSCRYTCFGPIHMKIARWLVIY